MLIFSMPRSGSTALAEKLSLENNLINCKEYFNRKLRGFHPEIGTWVIRGDLEYINNFQKVESHDIDPKYILPTEVKEKINILKNLPNIDDYLIKVLPHHVSLISDDFINFIDLFKNTHTFILDRKDTFRQFLSHFFAMLTNTYHSRDISAEGNGILTLSNLTKAYNNKFPNGVEVTQKDLDNFLNLYNQYLYGSLIIQKKFKNVEIMTYENIHYQKSLHNKKIELDYTNWITNVDEVKNFTNKLERYKEKVIYNEN